MTEPTRQPTDAELVDRCLRSTHAGAYNQLVRRHERWVRALAASLVNDTADAQDIAQEAFIRAYLCLPTLRDPARFDAWLRQVVIGLSKDLLRMRYAARRRVLSHAPQPRDQRADAGSLLDALTQAELSEVLMQLVAAMPTKVRLPLLLYVLDELTEREVADFLGLNVGTVRSIVHRAKARLKPAIERYLTQGMTMSSQPSPSDFAHKVMSARALKAVERGLREAARRDHAYLGTEHVLVGIAEEANSPAARALQACGITPAAIRDQIDKLLKNGSHAEPPHAVPRPPDLDQLDQLGRLLPPRALQAYHAAVTEALQQSEMRLTPEHLLLGVLGTPDCLAATILRILGANDDALRHALRASA